MDGTSSGNRVSHFGVLLVIFFQIDIDKEVSCKYVVSNMNLERKKCSY